MRKKKFLFFLFILFFLSLLIGFTFFYDEFISRDTKKENSLVDQTAYDIILTRAYLDSLQGCYINAIKPTIILRLDDVRAYSVPTPHIVDETLRNNISITLGVIPKNLEKDRSMVKYLRSMRENHLIEIAQHGTEHSESDRNITEEYLLQGYKIISDVLKVKPITYISPFNQVNEDSKIIISQYFRVLSGEEEVLKEGENMVEIGFTVSTYDFYNNQKINNSIVVDLCNKRILKTNTCIITLHPQEFAVNISDSNTVSTEKIEGLKDLLRRLESLNASFSNFRDLVVCENL